LVRRPANSVVRNDDNVISTPMYDTEEQNNKGPYYVPWKKTSMEAHDKYFAKKIYKNKKYLPDSTLGNVPTDEES
jgi:hypothetical protein